VKRKINGIVHDESATGKTVFIEPTEVVEANNKVRELEAAERREIIRILTVFSDEVRPHVAEILNSYEFLANIDLIHAKTVLALLTRAFEPEVAAHPCIDWIQARHPLLQLSLEKQEKKVVPLDIMLSGKRNEEGGKATGRRAMLGNEWKEKCSAGRVCALPTGAGGWWLWPSEPCSDEKSRFHR
jgi:DNA mismatch repair protein MutS2